MFLKTRGKLSNLIHFCGNPDYGLISFLTILLYDKLETTFKDNNDQVREIVNDIFCILYEKHREICLSKKRKLR